MEVVFTIGYCLVFYYIIRRSSFFSTASYPWLPGVLFLLKCISGILLGLIYTYYYTNHRDADSFKFFTDSKILFDAIYHRPFDFFRMLTGIDGKSHDLLHYYMEMNAWLNKNTLYNDNRTMVRLNAFFRFFSGGHYYTHVVFLNFISFAGLFSLFRVFVRFCKEKKTELLVLIFLMPSVMFWGSGLLKDGLLIGGFGIFIYSFSQLIYTGFSLRRIAFFSTGLIILLLTKVYVIVIILPGLAAWWFTRDLSGKKTILTFLTVYTVYLVILFSMYRLNDNYNVAAEIFYKQKNFIEIGDQHAASMIEPVQYECSGPSLLIHAPESFSNTLFRPFISDVHGNPMILLSAAENIFLILLMIICLIGFRPCESKAMPLVMFSLFFILLLFILIGSITPILGAMVRYRIIGIPNLIFLLILFFDRDRFTGRIALLRRKEKILSS